jgi:hypothetical protein
VPLIPGADLVIHLRKLALLLVNVGLHHSLLGPIILRLLIVFIGDELAVFANLGVMVVLHDELLLLDLFLLDLLSDFTVDFVVGLDVTGKVGDGLILVAVLSSIDCADLLGRLLVLVEVVMRFLLGEGLRFLLFLLGRLMSFFGVIFDLSIDFLGGLVRVGKLLDHLRFLIVLFPDDLLEFFVILGDDLLGRSQFIELRFQCLHLPGFGILLLLGLDLFLVDFRLLNHHWLFHHLFLQALNLLRFFGRLVVSFMYPVVKRHLLRLILHHGRDRLRLHGGRVQLFRVNFVSSLLVGLFVDNWLMCGSAHRIDGLLCFLLDENGVSGLIFVMRLDILLTARVATFDEAVLLGLCFVFIKQIILSRGCRRLVMPELTGRDIRDICIRIDVVLDVAQVNSVQLVLRVLHNTG